mgnify:CR=1 FL=1
MDFYSLDPEDLKKLDLTALTREEVKEIAYFTWCFYHYDADLMNWRETQVLPLVAFETPGDEEDDG